ncbi:HD domain-containing protein, partial [Chlorogloeopsis fritschii]
VIRMALIHDFGEIYAGDFTPHDEIEVNQKYQLERQSILQVLSKLNGGSEWIALWEEYEQGETIEAQFVRQLDQLEMILQASVYEHQELANLSEFFASANQKFTAPQLKAIFETLEDLRDNWNSR